MHFHPPATARAIGPVVQVSVQGSNGRADATIQLTVAAARALRAELDTAIAVAEPVAQHRAAERAGQQGLPL